jgi:hypothetical protein
VKVIVQGAKATNGYRKDFIEFFETLVDPVFALETVLIGKEIGLPAAPGTAVIPTAYGRIHQSEASFSHRKTPQRNNRLSQQNQPNRKTNATRCACPFLFLFSFLSSLSFLFFPYKRFTLCVSLPAPPQDTI